MNTFEIMKLIGNAPKELLTGIETAILMRMALFADRSGKGVRPGIVQLSNTTKFCERSIKYSLKALLKKELIINKSQRKHGSHDMSCYEINVELLKELISKSSRAPHAPESRARDALTPNTQLFKPDQPNNIVEFDANSTVCLDDKKNKKNWGIETQEVFRHWKKVMNHPMSKLDEHRRGKIVRALVKGFSVELLKKAIEGAKKSPFHMGDNDREEVYDDISLILRNRGQIEKFIKFFDTPPRGRDKNVSTGQKSTFFERSRKQLDLMNEIDKKLFSKIENKHNSQELVKKGES